jgi:hypothetical protein
VNRRDCRGEIDQMRAASPGVVVAVSRLAKGGVDPVGIDMSGLRTCGRILYLATTGELESKEYPTSLNSTIEAARTRRSSSFSNRGLNDGVFFMAS